MDSAAAVSAHPLFRRVCALGAASAPAPVVDLPGVKARRSYPGRRKPSAATRIETQGTAQLQMPPEP